MRGNAPGKEDLRTTTRKKKKLGVSEQKKRGRKTVLGLLDGTRKSHLVAATLQEETAAKESNGDKGKEKDERRGAQGGGLKRWAQ